MYLVLFTKRFLMSLTKRLTSDVDRFTLEKRLALIDRRHNDDQKCWNGRINSKVE
ncbi:hypothetical protein SAMN05421737_11256 [Shouchella lonarensis]|uniref:Uncharacterized protein n=1 Tax=Shouchella lonarensis TaxID=1464122 RepID=A0A1G6NGD9_9BACI|nr:hypothetical protein SAMN05421737_11256 [Shouchella lonarensis]